VFSAKGAIKEFTLLGQSLQDWECLVSFRQDGGFGQKAVGETDSDRARGATALRGLESK